jgi:SAM-dependent methyltransferase
MDPNPKIDQIRQYFDDKLKTYGATPQGADWNSNGSQETRFEQLCKVIEDPHHVTILDFGSGYGALLDYLNHKGYQIDLYVGYDILESMVAEGKQRFAGQSNVIFTSNFDEVPAVDYAVASGVFNIKLDSPYEDWTQFALDNLEKLNNLVRKGFASNFLTSYSDAERMQARADLFYADPCYLFDYCKKHFSRWVSILHDYRLYDFTLIVRKDQN